MATTSNAAMASGDPAEVERRAGDTLWVRGPGLNAPGAERRAEQIIGRGWRNAVEKATFLRARRGDKVQVRLERGPIVWVSPEYITSQPTAPQRRAEVELVDALHDIELGSEDEREDGQGEDGEMEGSLSNRHARTDGAWTETYITADQRQLDGYQREFSSHMRTLDDAVRTSPWSYFWAFIPAAALDDMIRIMLRKGKALWRDFELDRNLFFVWLGVWFRMCADKSMDRQSHWGDGVATGKWYRDTMQWETFRRIHSVLTVPQYEQDAPEKVSEVGDGEDKFQWFRKWLHACNAQFKAAWEPGTYLTVDETMVFWTGLGPVHLTYIPRKPSPLGVMFKVTCCGETGILLHAELVEGAAVDRNKRFVQQFKATTACTLRVTEHWWASGRVVIGDAWFGSVRTVEELLDVGLYSIMCVKQGCAGYPRATLRQLLQNRGDKVFFKTNTLFDDGEEVRVRPIFAGGHMDKQPLMLCASTGTSVAGEQRVRYRSKLVNGQLVKSRYTLDQPKMHAIYRRYYNAVDLHNRAALQPGTLPDTWKTKKCHRRLFAASIAWIETNAMLAYNKINSANPLTKQQWFRALSHWCIENPFRPPRPRAIDVVEGHGGPAIGSQALCWVCKSRTNWKCACGRPICGSTTRAKSRGGVKAQPRECYMTHLAAVFEGDEAHTGVVTTRRGPRPKV